MGEGGGAAKRRRRCKTSESVLFACGHCPVFEWFLQSRLSKGYYQRHEEVALLLAKRAQWEFVRPAGSMAALLIFDIEEAWK
jgi:hypothetical protein